MERDIKQMKDNDFNMITSDDEFNQLSLVHHSAQQSPIQRVGFQWVL